MSKSISGGVEIINTLSTKNDGDYPLVMAESVGMKDGANAEDVIKNKLNTNQGTENNGKFMKVGADGNLKPEIVPIPDVSAQINTHDKSPTSHNDIRDSVNTLKNDKLDKNQGVNNTGKIITVGDDGNVVTRFPNNVTYNPDTKNLEYGSNDSLPLIDGVKLDTSLTKGGFAADAKITGDKINKIESEATTLKEDLSAITDTETKTETHNIEQNVIKTSNYYYWNGKPTANTDYFYVHLDNLQEGDIITAIIDSAYQTMRFVDAYNGTNRLSSASVSSYPSLYTVPSGVDNVYITCLMRYVNDIQFYVKRTVTVSTITPKGFDVLNKKVGEISEKQDKIYANKSKNISIRGNLTTGNTLSTFVPNILTLKHLSFVCNLDTMGEIKIGHGENLNSIVVTDTELRTYYGTTLLRTKQHELTITKDLQIKIDVDANGNPKITIQSQGISYEYTDWNWFGNEENIFVESVNGAFNDCILSWSCDGFFKDIQLYGDSYFSCIDNSRWTKHLLNAGYTNNLLDGFSGRKSSQAYTSLIENLKYSNPKTIIWCMGMNDDDGDAVNEQWADYYEKVKTLCEENNIELILATIPNTPIRNHIYKNEIVRNSGYRYIDFAKAVNAESSGASWYDGMLNGDKVHPTELGAKTLYMRALADVPELMCS